MDIAHLLLSYIQVLIWPIVAFFVLWKYRDVIKSLVPRSKLKLTIAGVSIETSLETLQRSVEESFRGRRISTDQWTWLKRLHDSGRIPYNHTYYEQLRPLRNSGLIREHPEGWLSDAKEIEITTLGRLLLDAYQHSTKQA
jgi:hypothetical protein